MQTDSCSFLFKGLTVLRPMFVCHEPSCSSADRFLTGAALIWPAGEGAGRYTFERLTSAVRSAFS